MFINVSWVFWDDPVIGDCKDVARDMGKSFWETIMGVPVNLCSP